jgi:site-specific DNA-methyltransferase (cytosine-N4-specific)
MKSHLKNYHTFLENEVMTPFYLKRLNSLQALKLDDVLKRKNPYLFKAKNIELAGDLAKSIVDAFLSSQEETLFGNLLEGFAIHVAATLHKGFKSTHKSLDLEFQREGIYYIVGIKSGIYWGNSDQINTMKANFKKAREALRAEGITLEIVAVNGCIYGRDASPQKTDVDADKTYFKYAGQEFWRFLSGDDDLYRQIIIPIDVEAKKKDEAFRAAYNAKVHELTMDFSLNFLTKGQVDWIRLVDYVSRRERITLKTSRTEHQNIDKQILTAEKRTRQK